jgi:hypothetical protein
MKGTRMAARTPALVSYKEYPDIFLALAMTSRNSDGYAAGPVALREAQPGKSVLRGLDRQEVGKRGARPRLSRERTERPVECGRSVEM